MAKHKPLSEQVVVITGASSGIGLATARAAARRGAHVMLAARDEPALADICHHIQEDGGEARYLVADVSLREDVETLAAETVAAYGGFDTWVNNAGLSIFGFLEDVPEEDHRRLFEINFWGAVHGSLVAVRHLRRRGGALVNVGSVASDYAFPVQGMYGASKHALKGFTDALRMELKHEGAPVTVTLIKPHSIDTPLPTHARSYMAGRPTLPPPVYAPAEVAAAILHAAEHGGRDIYVGGAARMGSLLRKTLPWAADLTGAYVLSRMQTTAGADRLETRAPTQVGALDRPGRDGSVRGFEPRHAQVSLYTRVRLHPAVAAGVVAGLGLTAAALLRRGARN